MTRVPGFNAMQEPGFVALAERRFGNAVDAFQSVASASARRPAWEAVALQNVGYAQLWAGRLDEALASYEHVERLPRMFLTGSMRLTTAAQLLTNAIAGDLDTAGRWVDEGRRRLAKSDDSRLHSAAWLCLAEAIILVRRRRAADAGLLLEKNWAALRDTLTANVMRVVEIVRAHAEATSGGPRESAS